MEYPENFERMAYSLSSFCGLDFFAVMPATYCSMPTRTDLYYHKRTCLSLSYPVLGHLLSAVRTSLSLVSATAARCVRCFVVATYTLLPLVVSALMLVYYWIRRLHIAAKHRMDQHSLRPGRDEKRDERLHKLNNFTMFAFLLFTFLIFTSVSTVIFKVQTRNMSPSRSVSLSHPLSAVPSSKTFHTISFDDGSCYLRADLSTRCDTRRYKFWVFYSVLFTAVYVVIRIQSSSLCLLSIPPPGDSPLALVQVPPGHTASLFCTAVYTPEGHRPRY